MKKLMCLLVLLLIPGAFAISTDIGNKTYQPGETLILEVFGNILEPIQKSDIELKRNNVQVPFDYDIKKLGDNYFIYALLPKNENNYTLFIRDVSTTENGNPKTIDYNESIIVKGDLISYDIKPGFFSGTGDIVFDIFLYEDLPMDIQTDFPEERTYTLQPGENEIILSTEGVEPGFYRIQIGMYSIPILITGNSPTERRVIISPISLERTILIGKEVSYPFTLTNEGNEIIDSFVIDYDEDLFIVDAPSSLSLSPGESLEFVLHPRFYNEPIDETIFIRYGNSFIEVPVFLEFTEEGNNLPEDSSAKFYCSELGGKSCSAEEVCSGETVKSIDVNSCCVGTCSVPEKTTSYSWIGWLVGAIVLIIVVIIAGRYFKTKKPKVSKSSISSSLKTP